MSEGSLNTTSAEFQHRASKTRSAADSLPPGIYLSLLPGFNSLVGGIMGFSILISAEVFKHEPKVWYLDGTIGVLIGLIILAYGVK